MHTPPDGSTAQVRYGLVLVETPGRRVVEASPWRPVAERIGWAALTPRAHAERFAVAAFALAYLATFAWLVLRAVRWLTDG